MLDRVDCEGGLDEIRVSAIDRAAPGSSLNSYRGAYVQYTVQVSKQLHLLANSARHGPQIRARYRYSASMRVVLQGCCSALCSPSLTRVSKFTINGALPITVDNMKEMLSAAITQMRGEMRTELQELRVEGAVATGSSHLPSSSARHGMWMWGERMHMVPQGWTLSSSINLKDTWLLWYFGHAADRIGPLRGLKKFDLISKRQVTLWSKTRQTMSAVAEMMVQMGMVGTVQEVLTLGETDSAAFFDRAIVRLMEQLKMGVTRGRARWMEMKAPTVYALLLKSRKRRRAEEEGGGREEGEEREGEDEGEREEDDGSEEESHAATMLSQLNGRGRRRRL